tara:strand:+ start:107 stop:559 length:453 start_codon:yes stop_codon:yes gene_type:complete
MRLAERVVCCFLISLGGVYAYGIQQIQGRQFTSNEIGPTAFPWLMVSLLMALSVLLLVRPGAVPSQGGEEIIEERGAATRNTLVAVLLLFAYVGVLEVVGFLWATPIFLGLLSPLYGAGRLSLIVIAGMAIGFTAALHSILWFGFGVLLP